MMNMLRQLWKDEEGATALEYGLLVALIALAIVGGVAAFGTEINDFFNGITVAAGTVTG